MTTIVGSRSPDHNWTCAVAWTQGRKCKHGGKEEKPSAPEACSHCGGTRQRDGLPCAACNLVGGGGQ